MIVSAAANRRAANPSSVGSAASRSALTEKERVYKIDADTADLSNMRSRSGYLRDLREAVSDAVNAALHAYADASPKDRPVRMSAAALHENMGLLRELHRHTVSAEASSPERDAVFSEADVPVRDELRDLRAASRRASGSTSPAVVSLERIAAANHKRRASLYLALGGMRDRRAWFWPHARLGAFAARTGETTARGETLLTHARPVSRLMPLRPDEARYAVDPATEEIVPLRRMQGAPQLELFSETRRYVKEREAASGCAFYAINAQRPGFFTRHARKTTVGFLKLDNAENGVRRVRILIKTNHRGRGHASAALESLAQNVRVWHPETAALVLVAEAGNVGGRAVARKSGFVAAADGVEIAELAPKRQLTRTRRNPVEVRMTYVRGNLPAPPSPPSYAVSSQIPAPPDSLQAMLENARIIAVVPRDVPLRDRRAVC